MKLKNQKSQIRVRYHLRVVALHVNIYSFFLFLECLSIFSLFSFNYSSQNIALVKNPNKNVAIVEFGAKTISGNHPSALLDGNFTNYDLNTGKKRIF